MKTDPSSAIESGSENRRRDPRQEISDTLFIQTIGADQVTAVGANLKTGNAVNASLHGMQVDLDFDVPVDAEIALWITLPDTDDRIMVTGTVRWTRPAQIADRFLVGIELEEAAVPDMERWLAARTGG